MSGRESAVAEALAAIEWLHAPHTEQSGRVACPACLLDHPCPTILEARKIAAALDTPPEQNGLVDLLLQQAREGDEAAAAVARVRAIADQWDQRSKGESPTTARIRAALAGVGAQAEAATLRAHRREWADYIERWEGAIGPKPPNARTIVALLRAEHPPFGAAQGSADPGPS